VDSRPTPHVLGRNLCLRGIAVEKETENDLEVLDISRDQVALCSLNIAMTISLTVCEDFAR
jgi:hypothetical protein